MKFYISFGQAHAHSIAGMTFDKDSLMLVEAGSELIARLGVSKLTGGKWCGTYHESELASVQRFFPRGVINEDAPLQIFVEGYKVLEDGRTVKTCDGNHGGPRCDDPECWNQ
jgi:hypothetical protein